MVRTLAWHCLSRGERTLSFVRSRTVIGWNWRGWLLAFAMILAATLANYVKPKHRLVDPNSRIDIGQVIPKHFGDWRVDESISPVQPAPDVRAQLENIYDQTFAATYVDSKGERVMLSLAYGEGQTKATSLHRPEVCYPAQGFQLEGQYKDQISTPFGTVRTRRVLAVLGRRVEPITYWIRVGDELASGGLEQKMAGIRYGLVGVIPDGLLFRVSSISVDPAKGYQLQDRFVRELLGSIDIWQRRFLVGRLADGQGQQ
jgi:EpsI family protein